MLKDNFIESLALRKMGIFSGEAFSKFVYWPPGQAMGSTLKGKSFSSLGRKFLPFRIDQFLNGILFT